MQAKYFVFGVLATLFFLVLIGAIGQQGSSSANLSFGRYQLSSWATSFGEKGGGAVGAFVIDTVSGETRTVYNRTYGPPMESAVIKNDLKKPYSAIE